LHQDVSAERPAPAHAQQTGRQSSGLAHADPGAPFFHANVCASPAQSVSRPPALAIDPASVTAIAPELQTSAEFPPQLTIQSAAIQSATAQSAAAQSVIRMSAPALKASRF